MREKNKKEEVVVKIFSLNRIGEKIRSNKGVIPVKEDKKSDNLEVEEKYIH